MIGNKTDCEDHRVISTEQGQELADKLGIKFMETSAANNTNVKEMFMTLVQDVYERCESQGKFPSSSDRVAVGSDQQKPEQSGGCC